METALTKVSIRGGEPPTAGRLEYVRSLICRRLEALAGGALVPPDWRQAPAFELHVESGIERIMSDGGECLRMLRFILLFGERAGVVVYHHEPAAVWSEAVSAHTSMVVALMAGRVLRSWPPQAVTS